MKESIVRILTPDPKVPIQQPPSDEPLQEITLTQEEIAMSEELPQPEQEPMDIIEPASMRFVSTDSSGWRVSDILREIRLDNFELGSLD